ncbi:hypothetical protein [Microtetraspora sp. NBRC 16547]|uniref:hypothetical protein n=1 Tax=Microtetraspora sp. NBRC 16547 TaxID=3030993 RepID=UPI0024A32A0B|nr:hypothetical protein [Microtetraspora sp. NBRC 16547]GLX03032.1 hypothetical protein Misp02_71180 [Microtetraspora sp. NBRC 16547]
MSAEVTAENLKVGDLVELPTQFGPQVIRLTLVEPRVNGLKFTGLRSDGARYSFGMKYEQIAILLDS